MRCALPFVLVSVFSVVTAAHAGLSDVSCDDRSRLTKTLQHTLGAERKGTGLRDPETMLEVWVTSASGDWLIVQHYASGTSCIVAMGEYWDAAGPSPSG